MQYIQRVLKIDLPKKQSAFLWGARKTGKSTYLKQRFPQSFIYDFLKTDLFFEFSKRPSLLREQLLVKDEQILSHPVILDEVQKIPKILDEVHWLIENKNFQFILCGSSARKLKRGQANLLGGRAWRFHLFPFITLEIQNFNLLRALNQGLIPAHYLQDHHYQKSLRAYVQDYLKEEVFQEGLIRNLPAFSRFFDAMGYSHGEQTNYSNIARECGIDSKTVREYYQILVDTLLGTMVPPYKKRQSRQVISKSSKFYLFDVGIASMITHRQITEERGVDFGRAFEHFIFMEMIAHRSYKELDYDIHFWRTKSGMEVDFILGEGEVAIEVKGSNRIDNRDLSGLKIFVEDNKPKRAILVCNEKEERLVGNIHIMPWRLFLELLWGDQIIM